MNCGLSSMRLYDFVKSHAAPQPARGEVGGLLISMWRTSRLRPVLLRRPVLFRVVGSRFGCVSAEPMEDFCVLTHFTVMRHGEVFGNGTELSYGQWIFAQWLGSSGRQAES